MAVFTCETRGDVTGWRINRTPVENLPHEVEEDFDESDSNRNDGTAVVNLSILAKPEYNGSKVQCVVVMIITNSYNAVESNNATLTIQGKTATANYSLIINRAIKLLGLLSTPPNLVISYNRISVTISWSAPFSLDVTGVDPDIWYFVFIYNVTDKNNPTAILCTDCISITETHYTFTPDYLGPCHVYNFSVIPVNGAGQGESSPNITSCVQYGGIIFVKTRESILFRGQGKQTGINSVSYVHRSYAHHILLTLICIIIPFLLDSAATKPQVQSLSMNQARVKFLVSGGG